MSGLAARHSAQAGPSGSKRSPDVARSAHPAPSPWRRLCLLPAALALFVAALFLLPAGTAQAQVLSITVESAGTTSLKVTWNALSGAVRYFVDWRVSGSTSNLTTQSVTTTTYTITNLTPGTEYFVQVRAVASNNNVFGVNGATGTTQGVLKISAIAITSSPPAGQNGFYKRGDKVEITATFSAAITVTGTPKLELQVGSNPRSSSCAAHASDTKKLVCSYTVGGDRDGDGISVGANKLTLPTTPAATIKDLSNNAVTLTHSALAAQSGHKADGYGPVATFDSATPTVGTAYEITITDDLSKVAAYAVREVAGTETSFIGSSCDNPSDDNFSLTPVSPAESPHVVSYTPQTAGKKLCVYARDVAGNGWGGLHGTAIAQTTAKPAKPTGLTATAGNAQVRLAWTNPSDSSVTKYQYQQKAGSSIFDWGSWTNIPDSAPGGTNATSYTVSSLRNGTAYRFRIRAVNAAGNGPVSDIAGPVTPQATTTVVPAAPAAQTVPSDWACIPKDSSNSPRFTAGQSFRLLFITSTSATLTNTGIAHYNGVARTSAATVTCLSGFSGQFRAVVSTRSVDARDNTATTGRGVPIYWQGGAKVADDYADFYDNSWDSIAGKRDDGRSAAGTALESVTGSDSDGTKHASAYAGASSVRWGSLQSSSKSPLSETSLATTLLPSGPIYALSPVITVQAATKPAKPTGLTATAGNAQVRLAWTSPGDSTITRYQVQRKAGSAAWGAWSDIPESAAGGTNATSYTVTSLTGGTVYRFRIRAVNAVGTGPESDIAGPVTPRGATPPPPVTQTVAPNWSLIPTDSSNRPLFTAGQRFRLLFVTSTGTPATSSDISTYNTFVQNRANANTTLRPFKSQFRALISTATVDARDNTATTGTGVPIYWVGGEKVADNYADFYDGSWDSRAGKSESGGTYSLTSYAWTGSNADGTKYVFGNLGPAGSTGVQSGRLSGSDSPLSAGTSLPTVSQRLYALSPVLRVQAAGSPPDLRDARASTAGPGSVTLYWRGSNDRSITKYRYQQKKTGDEAWGSWTDIRRSGWETSHHTVEGLENGVEYAFRIRAVSGNGAGPPSVVRWATPGSVAAHGVTLARFVVEPYDDRLELRWRKLAGRTYCGYVVEWRETGGSGEWERHEFTTNHWGVDYTIGDLKPGTSYDVRVLVQSGYWNIAPELAWERTRTTTGTALSEAPPITASAPALEWARVNGAALALRFDTALDGSSVPGTGAFAVSVGGSARGVSSVAVDRDMVALTLAQAVTAGETVTVGYTPPSSGKLRAAGGGAVVAAFSGQAAANDTPARQVAAGLTASVSQAPPEHRGKGTFVVRIAFSEAVAATPQDAAVQVTGGTLSRAVRVDGRLDLWWLTVKPSSHGAVTVVLPATSDCAAPGAVCTADGRRLETALTHTVQGPAALSVADARAKEGRDATIGFAVTLSRAASSEVTVRYATRDGSAKKGEDYRKAKGTLTFAAGETAKTVSVTVLDDALDEGEETFTLRLNKAKGAVIADGEATGTIANDDPLQKMWLSRFGRTVASHVTDAVSDRLANPLSGAQVTVGGQTVDLAAMAEDEARVGEALTAVARALGAREAHEPGEGSGSLSGASGWPATGLGGIQTAAPGSTPAREVTGRELLLGSAFHLAREGDGTGPGLAAWGRVTVGGFDGEAPADGGTVRIDGNVTTGILGADAQWTRLLGGVAISVSEGEGSFDQPGVDKGAIESTMTTVSPYARFMVTDRVSVWGLAGWGTGDMTIVQDARAANGNQPERAKMVTRTDLEMRLGAIGGRGALLTQDADGGMDLALKADAFFVETESEAVSNEGNTTANASRMRLVLEGGRAFAMGDGATLRPSLELGLRHDGGDAETGTGVELGGGVAYTDPVTGLSVEAKARMLVAHADSNYEEWGVSGAVRLAPGERQRGLSFSLAPTLGATSSAAERLWGARDAGGLAPGGEFAASRGLQGELGYGMSVFGDRFTGTPNVGFGLSDDARDYRIGWRLTSAVRGDPGFEVNLDATRREAANGNEPPEHGVMLRGAIRW